MAKYRLHNNEARAEFIRVVNAVDFEKGAWVAEIKRASNKRTLSQNALYHVWIGILVPYFGYSHDDMGQEAMKHLIKPTRYVKSLTTGEQEPRWSTTDLDTIGMAEYMTQLSAWAASEHAISLPHPEDRQFHG